MLNDIARPSTLSGIKRLAKQVKKKNGVTHHEGVLGILPPNIAIRSVGLAIPRL